MTAPTNEMHGTSRLVIREGKLEEFKRLVAEEMEMMRAKEPGTIEFNVYLNAEGTEAFVHERYRDSAAGMAHSENVASLMPAFLEVATITGEVCGNPPGAAGGAGGRRGEGLHTAAIAPALTASDMPTVSRSDRRPTA